MKRENLTDKQIIRELRQNWGILKKYGVKKAGLFGSYVTKTQSAKSDIDLLIEFQKPSLDNYIWLAGYLEGLFKRKVDILTPLGLESIRIKKVSEEIKRSLIYV